MAVACNSIFMRIFIAKVVMDSRGMFFKFDKTDGFQPKKVKTTG